MKYSTPMLVSVGQKKKQPKDEGHNSPKGSPGKPQNKSISQDPSKNKVFLNRKGSNPRHFILDSPSQRNPTWEWSALDANSVVNSCHQNRSRSIARRARQETPSKTGEGHWHLSDSRGVIRAVFRRTHSIDYHRLHLERPLARESQRRV